MLLIKVHGGLYQTEHSVSFVTYIIMYTNDTQTSKIMIDINLNVKVSIQINTKDILYINVLKARKGETWVCV